MCANSNKKKEAKKCNGSDNEITRLDGIENSSQTKPQNIRVCNLS